MGKNHRATVLIAMFAALATAGCSGTDSMLPSVPTRPSAAVPPAPPPAPPPEPEPPPPARYTVTFTATWSAGTHDVPPDPHFSPLIGGTHNSMVSFWRDGALASDGIKDMAERGRTSPLDTEIQAAIAAGTAQHILRGSGIGSPGATSVQFDISAAFPLVTLVTMVAPSPDWFAGVSSVSLLDGNQWVDERTISLIPWDAGTDSGETFTSPDRPTSPRELISRILTRPLGNGASAVPLGTFTFRRQP